MYELTMDSTNLYPSLNPTLLSRIRTIAAVWPRGLVAVITAMHIYVAAVFFYVCGKSLPLISEPAWAWVKKDQTDSSSLLWSFHPSGLAVKMGPLPSSSAWLQGRIAFPVNVLVKIIAWRIYQSYEGRCKQRIIKSSSSMDLDSSSSIGEEREEQAERRRAIRRHVVLYYSTSDLLLLIFFSICHAFHCHTLSFEDRVLVSLLSNSRTHRSHACLGDSLLTMAGYCFPITSGIQRHCPCHH